MTFFFHEDMWKAREKKCKTSGCFQSKVAIKLCELKDKGESTVQDLSQMKSF